MRDAGERKDSRKFSAMCEELFARGLSVRFRASGRSMEPNILDGDAVIVAPGIAAGARRGHVAFTRGPQGFRAHRVMACQPDNSGHVITRGDAGLANDPTASAVLGNVVSIERGRRIISASGPRARFTHGLHRRSHRAWMAARRRANTSFLAAFVIGLLALIATPTAFAASSLTVTLTSAPASGSTVQIGTTVTYSSTLTSSGTFGTTVNGATVTFADPNGMTYVSSGQAAGGTAGINWTCVHATGTVTCTINGGGGFPRNDSSNFTFTYKTGIIPVSSTTTPSTAQAKGSGSNVTTVTSGTVTLNIAALTLANNGTPTLIAPSNTLTYAFTLSNSSGFNAAAPVTVTMPDPPSADVTFVSAGRTSGTGTWTCDNGVTTPNTVTCTDSAAYNTGSTTNFSIVFTVNSSTPNNTSLSETVAAQSSNMVNGTLALSVTAVTPLTITNAAAPTTVQPSANITYTIVLTNSSGLTATANETVSMPDPPNTTFVSAARASGTGTWACDNNVTTANTVTCKDTTNYASGSTTTFTFIFTVVSGTPNGTVIPAMTATASCANAPQVSGASGTVTVQGPVLTVTNAAAPSTVTPGDPITFTVGLSNASGSTVTPNVTVTMPDPANTTFVSAASTGGSGTWTCNNTTTPNTVTCTDAANYTNGNATTFSFVFTVNAATTNGTTITGVASAQGLNTGGIGTASASSTAQAPDISVTNVANPTPEVAAGATITYTQIITNNGASEALGASFSEAIPANTIFKSDTAPSANWTCGVVAGTLTCTANNGTVIAAGGTATLTVVVTVNPGTAAAAATITDTVTVSETGTDPNLANNTATASVTVTDADLAMTQTVSPAVTSPGSVVTYNETVTNNGPDAATNVALYQQTPPNTTFAGITAPGTWTCTTPLVGNTGQILCTIGSLAVNTGTPAAFTVQVTVNSGVSAPAAGTTIQNYADVTSQTADPLVSNNATQTSTLVEITGDADVGGTGAASPTPVFTSSTLIYTFQVTNYGLAASSGTTLTDTLPTGVTYVSYTASQGSCTPTGTPIVTSVSCSLGSLAFAPSSPVTVTITVTTPNAATTLTNNVSVASTSTDPFTGNNNLSVVTVVQPLVCATPGKDGAPTSPLTAMVNAYYPPGTAVTGAPAGATSVNLGAASGAATPIAAGDLLLFIQMQGATINTNPLTDNTGAYGDGVPGDPGSGSTLLGNSGQYEFVTATNTTPVPVTGGTLTFIATGAGGGLLNSYTETAASATQGQTTFQVIRVPQYSSVTIGTGLTAFAWNGSVGGVLALDVSSQLTLSGTVSVDAEGFRGGGGRILAGGTGAGTDYFTLSTDNTNGSKGEGIAGTPTYIAPNTNNITLTTAATATGQTYVEGIPPGSYARGAPGNAGGGATDAHPAANDQNSGGGGGGNGGSGGVGGFGWSSAGIVGGFGGVAFPGTTSALVLGGGAGAGTTNNGSYWLQSTETGNANCGANCTGIYSSGTTGGGIVIIRAGSVIGAGTITANGQAALQVSNDGGGGGGAGGSILVFANSGSFNNPPATSLSIQANGGNGGITWPDDAPGTPFPGNRHGPGGGGGGGIALLTSAPNGLSLLGGLPGYTTLADDAYGATPGQMGVYNTNFTITQTPGTQSGAYCSGADLAVTNTDVTNTSSPAIVVPTSLPNPPATITYTQTVTNNNASAPFDALNAVFSEAIPANTTLVSVIPSGAGAAGWTCTTAGNIVCTNPDVPYGASGTTVFTVVVDVASSTPTGTQIIDTATITSATSDPNLTNNSATDAVLVAAANTADLTITQTASPNPVAANGQINYSILVTNNGPATATAVSYTEAISSISPVYATFQSLACAGGWSCSTPSSPSGTGTVSGTIASLAPGATASFTLVLNVANTPPSGTVISETANISSSITDPNPESNAATSNVVVAAVGQYDLVATSSASPVPVLAGNNITYTQTIGNSGPASVSGVVFNGSVPANTTLVSFNITPTGMICTAQPATGGTGPITCCPGTGTSCSGAAVALGTQFSVSMVVNVNPGTPPGTVISNTISLTPTANDVTPADNSATATTVVASPTQAYVTIVKTASPQPVDQGTNLTYTIQVTNYGPAIAQGVTVIDPLPTEVTYGTNPATSTQGSCPLAGNTVTCTIGSMSVGSTVTITINVDAATFSSTTYATNTATLTTTTSNPNPNTCPTIPVTICSSVTSTIEAPTAVQLSDFRAELGPKGGVLVEWHTKEEVRNLGFHLYREDGGVRHRLDPSLIAGGALVLRGGRPQHSAKTYQWTDPNGNAASTYWVEDVDLNGTRTMHGPVQPTEATSGADVTAFVQIGRSTLLSELNRVTKQASTRANTTTAQFNSVNPRAIPWPQPATPPSGDTVSNATLNSEAAVKISVSQAGWYQVTGAQLSAAGLGQSSPANLHLYAEGNEQPIIVNSQSASLGPNDAIEFYGTGIDTPFSGTRVYWLVSNAQPALRVAQVASPGGNPTTETDFTATTVLQQRTTYFAALLNGENNDNFFGAVVTSEPVDQQLAAPHINSSSSIPVTIDVTLQGGTDQQAHAVSVAFNGSSIGEIDFANLTNTTQTLTVPNGLLQEGANTVTLTALNGDNDVSLVQSIALHYPHTFTADSNWLNATAADGASIDIDGFSSPRIEVFDVTNPYAIQQLTGPIALDGSSTYGISLRIAGKGGLRHSLVAFSVDQFAAPDALAYHQPNNLTQPQSGASYVVITHPDFASSVTPLVNLHESAGQTAQVVTTDQIFDAFNFGERSPFAIRAFLQFAATQWHTTPQAVLLVGDASFDPRNYLGMGDFDFVPTRMIETQALKTASDDWLTDFNETGYATIPTGRIPADTPDEAGLAVSKIVSYEQGATSGAWQQQATFVADQNIGDNFTAAAQAAGAIVPQSIQLTNIFTDGLDPSTAQQQIVAAINNGTLFVDYSGHGAEDQWSFSDFFDATTVPALTNGDKLPVFLLMDCLNGYFEDVYSTSMAEDLLFAPNGGAVAVWASSGFTDEPPQATMNEALLSALSANPAGSVGQAILQAKTGISDPDVRRTWTLFGDPGMTIPMSGTGPSPQKSTRAH